MGTRRRRHRGDRGAQVVEFALIIPIVLLLIGAVVQFGFVLNTQVTVTQSAREAARLAALCGSTCSPSVTSKAKSAAPGLTGSKVTVLIQYCPSGGSCTGTTASPGYCPAGATQSTGDALVIVSYPQNLGAPLLSFNLTVKGKARMPCGG